ncbi:rhodanese-like domain-containing protein [Marixanthomonas spongiae]|uniref:Rhodanese-like domain-containing protein n=2 Tax=Marixanthomonas spongiae TaxID=2174845 RepID=A0A2U0HVG5_9FLAO|nr:rhodanese-like domain-containing protein [Marixanthomonas spongiae]
MRKYIIIMTLLSTLFGVKAQQTDAIKILSASEFREAIAKKNVQLVDVRTAREFKGGAIKGALNIDYFQQENFNAEFNKLDKEQPVYLYCHSGNRSKKAAAKLDALGFKKIYDLKGGYMKWPYKK